MEISKKIFSKKISKLQNSSLKSFTKINGLEVIGEDREVRAAKAKILRIRDNDN